MAFYCSIFFCGYCRVWYNHGIKLHFCQLSTDMAIFFASFSITTRWWVFARKGVEPSAVLEDIIKLHEICRQHGVGTSVAGYTQIMSSGMNVKNSYWQPAKQLALRSIPNSSSETLRISEYVYRCIQYVYVYVYVYVCVCVCVCVCVYVYVYVYTVILCVYIYIHIIANQKMRNQTDKTLRIWGAGIDLDLKSLCLGIAWRGRFRSHEWALYWLSCVVGGQDPFAGLTTQK